MSSYDWDYLRDQERQRLDDERKRREEEQRRRDQERQRLDDERKRREEEERRRRQEEDDRRKREEERRRREQDDERRRRQDEATKAAVLVQCQADLRATQEQQTYWDRQRSECLTELERLRRDREQHVLAEIDLRARVAEAERELQATRERQDAIEKQLEEDRKQRISDRILWLAEHLQDR